MKRPITRALYRLFLGWHPEPFRIEFGEEMLEIFEESVADQGLFFVLADVVRSAARQQVRYHTAPAPKRDALYAEVPQAPELARIFASAVFVLILAATAGMGGATTKPQEFHITNGQPRLTFSAVSVSSPKLTPRVVR